MDETEIPQQFREYKIQGVIGTGGMGKVYKARHIYLDEERAIKVIHPKNAEKQDKVDSVLRFILEAKVLTKLRHPNLVLLYDFGIMQEDTFFMVMEYIQGESVLSRLQRLKKIPIDEAIRIVREAALGLHSAHQQGIVHRDISPDNILVVKQPDGKEITKVIDFGIAKVLMAQKVTKTGIFVGKPAYSSPEQLSRTGKIDHRADIYSLGATLYHMLTGIIPFEEKNVMRTLQRIMNEQLPAPSSFFSDKHFPKVLDRIIQKTMAKDPNSRYSSMEHFVADLDSILAPRSPSTETQEDFVLKIAHEIRTRLNVIIGYAELLEEDALETDRMRHVHDLRKIVSAGKHLLWFIGQHPKYDAHPDPNWTAQEIAKYWYDRMEWENAIEYWNRSLEESMDKDLIRQNINAAETRLNTEHQLRTQVTEQLHRCNSLLDQKRLVEARKIMDDAERNLSNSYRLKDLKQQWFHLLRRLKSEIDAVLREHSSLAQMKDQIRKAIQTFDDPVPDVPVHPKTMPEKIEPSQPKHLTKDVVVNDKCKPSTHKKAKTSPDQKTEPE